MKKTTILIFSLLFILSSCSVEKRLYMSGYNINWKKLKQNIINRELINPIDTTLIASADNSIILTDINRFSFLNKTKSFYIIPLNECDIMILRNGDEIKIKVIEVGTGEIKYKKCDYKEGPTYVVKKSEVFMIKYSNGTKDVFKEETKKETPPERIQTQEIIHHYPDLEIKQRKKVNGFALTGFILAILGIPLLSIIFSAVGISQIDKNPSDWMGKGFAVAGLSIGFFYLIFILAIFLPLYL